MDEIVSIEVQRDDLGTARVARRPLDVGAEVVAGRTVLAVDRFALTANNITYGAFGDQMSYWAFFPASAGFGHIPVWGFADVVATPHQDLPTGTRVYGYFPMATHLVLTADRINARRFVDAAPHRSALPPVYNTYERVAADPAYQAAREGAQALLRPLVVTSFLIADFLDDNALFGATRVLVSSASSKTSIGLAQCLRRLGRPGLETVGLTSAGNLGFVERLGLFDRVLAYDRVDALDADVPTVYVDMAGSAEVLSRVHRHIGERLAYSCRVGGTHWQGLAGRMDLPGARPKFFFAPDQIRKRMTDWGPGGLEQRFAAVWPEIIAKADGWLRIETRTGAEAVLAAYREKVRGRVAPEAGLMLSMR